MCLGLGGLPSQWDPCVPGHYLHLQSRGQSYSKLKMLGTTKGRNGPLFQDLLGVGQEKRGRHGARRARFSGAVEGAVQNPAEASLAWGDSRDGLGLRVPPTPAWTPGGSVPPRALGGGGRARVSSPG